MLALACAFPVALVSTRYPGALSRAAERSSYVGYALPGLVVALAFVFLASNALPRLYQTLPLVVVAYVVLFLPQVTEPLRGALLQLSPRLEEAGRSLGRSKRAVFRAVTVPLVSRPMLAGLALVFVTAMKELPATLLLRPTGFETLATEVWSWASIGAYSQAAAPALLLIVVSAGPLYLLSRRLDVGRWFGAEFAGERIATLAEALARVRGRVGRVYTEVKGWRGDGDLDRILADVRAAAVPDHVFISPSGTRSRTSRAPMRRRRSATSSMPTSASTRRSSEPPATRAPCSTSTAP